MVDLESKVMNTSLYRRTKLKMYEVFICKPNIGTCCINRLNRSSVVTTEDKPFVVFVSGGDYSTASIDELKEKYRTSGSKSLDEHIINKHCSKDGTMRWIRASRKSTDDYYWALEIEEEGSVKLQGKEECFNSEFEVRDCNDFVICKDKSGKPDLSTVKRINGTRFLTMYKTKYFKNLTNVSINLHSKPKIDIANNDSEYDNIVLDTKLSDTDVLCKIQEWLDGTKPFRGETVCSSSKASYKISVIQLNGERYIRIKKIDRRLDIDCWTNFVPVTSDLIYNIYKIIHGKKDNIA